MRLSPKHKNYIITLAEQLLPEVKIYLFGSRTDDNAKGGDIDLLLLSQTKLPTTLLRKFRIALYKHIGWQKIDAVNFTFEDNSTFKQIALENAVLLR